MSAAKAPVEFYGAIDFGVTASKGAYHKAMPNGSGDRTKFVLWGDGNERTAPTMIGDPNSADSAFGWDAAEDRSAFRLFKLMLDSGITDTAGCGRFFDEAEAHAAAHGHSGFELTSAYLQRLWGAFKTFVGRRQGSSDLHFHMVFTIPDMWLNNNQDSGPKANMLRAIRDAEIPFDEANFCSEGLAALLHFHKYNGEKLQPNDVVIVCDIGGGTIDAVAFQKTGATDLTPESARRTSRSISRLGGAVVLDSGFLDFAHHSSDILGALEAWQEAKLQFTGEEIPTQVWEITDVHLSKHQIQMIFDSLLVQVNQILNELVHEVFGALRKTPEYIYLTGGVATNEYLRKTILVPVGTELTVARNPDLAVAEGGLIYAQKFAEQYKPKSFADGATGKGHPVTFRGSQNSLPVRPATGYGLVCTGRLSPAVLVDMRGELVNNGAVPRDALQERRTIDRTELEAHVVQLGNGPPHTVARLTWTLGPGKSQNWSVHASMQSGSDGELLLAFAAVVDGVTMTANIVVDG